jgi:hypothetical protein
MTNCGLACFLCNQGGGVNADVQQAAAAAAAKVPLEGDPADLERAGECDGDSDAAAYHVVLDETEELFLPSVDIGPVSPGKAIALLGWHPTPMVHFPPRYVWAGCSFWCR